MIYDIWGWGISFFEVFVIFLTLGRQDLEGLRYSSGRGALAVFGRMGYAKDVRRLIGGLIPVLLRLCWKCECDLCNLLKPQDIVNS